MAGEGTDGSHPQNSHGPKSSLAREAYHTAMFFQRQLLLSDYCLYNLLWILLFQDIGVSFNIILVMVEPKH